jgi:hypothetical protein
MASAHIQAKWDYNGHVGEREDVHSIPQHPTKAPHFPSPPSSGAMGVAPIANRHVDEMVPQALALHVMLGDRSFMRGYDDGKPRRCMIDVFFNGQLSSSVLVNWKEIHTWHQVFSGVRVGHMAERPWIVLPPGQNADGSLRGLERATSVRERWQQISSALMQEVKARGANKYGERPPSADYLHSLATMQMSEAVNRLQNPGGRRFGVIDVVITAGDGKKLNNGMSYLKTPMRIADQRYRSRPGGEKNTSRSPARSSHWDAEGETNEGIEHESQFRYALTAPAPQHTMPPLPSSVFPPPSLRPEQLPQTPSLLPSVSVFPPFPTAILESSTGHTGMEHGSLSSPILKSRQFTRDNQPCFTSSGTPAFSDPIPMLGTSFPSFPPTRPRQVSFSLANSASFDIGAPPGDTTTIGSEILRGDGHPVPHSLPQILPLANKEAGRHAPVLLRGASFITPPLGRPPPVGFFSAPRAAVDFTMVDPELPPLSILITRFVVTGKNGRLIVDHRWRIAQRIAITKSKPKPAILFSRPPARSFTKVGQSSLRSEEYSEFSIRTRQSDTSINRLTTPPTSSPSMVDTDNTMSANKRKRDSIHDGHLIRGPSMPPLRSLALAPISGSHLLGARTSTEHKPNISTDGSSLVPNIQVIVSHRRGHQTLPFFGVQGPKAAPFIIEDPEELLRRRAKSPTKQNTAAGVTSHPSQLASGVEVTGAAACLRSNHTITSEASYPTESRGTSLSNAPSSECKISGPRPKSINLLESSSSDLSSAPSSPKIALSQTGISAHSASIPLSSIPDQPLLASDDISSSVNLPKAAYELPPEKDPRASSPPGAPNSPGIPLSGTQRVITAKTTAAFASQPAITVQTRLVTPHSSVSSQKPSTSSTSSTRSPTKPSKKKRRTTSIPSRTQPRIYIPPPPIDTSKNPPLNQDCVLAFAVTGTLGTEGDERVLRQVKSERQGTFEEEEVVCGMRFFVAG